MAYVLTIDTHSLEYTASLGATPPLYRMIGDALWLKFNWLVASIEKFGTLHNLGREE
jgi:hypothetical protein